jgi:hypothetical protein
MLKLKDRQQCINEFVFDLWKVLGGLMGNEHVVAEMERVGVTDEQRVEAYSILGKIAEAFWTDGRRAVKEAENV